MLSNLDVKHFEQITNLRSRLRYDLGIPGFRSWVQIYAVDPYECPSFRSLSIQRSRKVRLIIEAYYPINSSSLELREYAAYACNLLDEILPSVTKLPTHFLIVGIEIEGKDEPIFKTYLDLSNGIRSSSQSAKQIGEFIFNYFEDRIHLTTENLNRPQAWVLDCLLSQWRLLKLK
jgi:hypothetical protein